eukprot:2708422-Rhodomonas_salina.2
MSPAYECPPHQRNQLQEFAFLRPNWPPACAFLSKSSLTSGCSDAVCAGGRSCRSAWPPPPSLSLPSSSS